MRLPDLLIIQCSERAMDIHPVLNMSYYLPNNIYSLISLICIEKNETSDRLYIVNRLRNSLFKNENDVHKGIRNILSIKNAHILI